MYLVPVRMFLKENKEGRVVSVMKQMLVYVYWKLKENYTHACLYPLNVLPMGGIG